MTMKQLTEEQAIALHDGGEWKDWTLDEVARFQLFQSKLCVPFSLFHQAIEHALDRPVWTHEFADQGSLQAEYIGENDPPTFEEIIEMIPEEKRLILRLR
jgi:hypothetical protein